MAHNRNDVTAPTQPQLVEVCIQHTSNVGAPTTALLGRIYATKLHEISLRFRRERPNLNTAASGALLWVLPDTKVHQRQVNDLLAWAMQLRFPLNRSRAVWMNDNAPVYEFAQMLETLNYLELTSSFYAGHYVRRISQYLNGGNIEAENLVFIWHAVNEKMRRFVVHTAVKFVTGVPREEQEGCHAHFQAAFASRMIS